MSLFSAIQTSANSLQVNELGLNVVGNNIANANTEGYIRQELIQNSGPGILIGGVILGYGVRAIGVVQKTDAFLADQLRQAQSALSASQGLGNTYGQIEAIFNELTDSDLSTQLSTFSSSVQDILNQPGNESLRRLLIERAKTLTFNIRNMRSQLNEVSNQVNAGIKSISDEINRLTERLASINVRISALEGGGIRGSDAVGLRDERYQLLNDLSKIVDIKPVEQNDGSVSVFVGGEYLVAQGIVRKVEARLNNDPANPVPEIRLSDTDSPLIVSGGSLKAVYDTREKGIGRVVGDLDGFAQLLIQQFNLIHSQGQGQKGFTDLTSTYSADDPSGPVDLAGYDIQVKNGSFEIQVTDLESSITHTTTIRINLTGSNNDTSLEGIRAAIDAVSGISASIEPGGKLRIRSDTPKLQFSFQNDNSQFLAAAGLNTFFDGNSAENISLNSVIANDPGCFAASLNGIGNNTENAVRMARAFDEPVEALNGNSIKQIYENNIVRMTQDINVEKGKSDGLQNYFRVLQGKLLSISGVNLDEEAIKMMFYQRAFQASSRVIKASDELLDTLVNL